MIQLGYSAQRLCISKVQGFTRQEDSLEYSKEEARLRHKYIKSIMESLDKIDQYIKELEDDSYEFRTD